MVAGKLHTGMKIMDSALKMMKAELIVLKMMNLQTFQRGAHGGTP